LRSRWWYLGLDGWVPRRRGDRFDRGRTQPRSHYCRDRARLYLRDTGPRPTPTVTGMSSRRRGRALVLVLTLATLAAFVVPVTLSGALAASGINENSVTLNLSLPGPFNGCSYLSTLATPTTDALLDLTQPSAFVTNPNGTLAGEGGAISSAELTSLSPETVRYTIGANQYW